LLLLVVDQALLLPRSLLLPLRLLLQPLAWLGCEGRVEGDLFLLVERRRWWVRVGRAM
jgi:hypothetical protein